MVEDGVPKTHGPGNQIGICHDIMPTQTNRDINPCVDHILLPMLLHSFNPKWPLGLPGFGPIPVGKIVVWGDGILLLVEDFLICELGIEMGESEGRSTKGRTHDYTDVGQAN